MATFSMWTGYRMTLPFKYRLLVCIFVLQVYSLPNIIFIIKPRVISMNRALAFTLFILGSTVMQWLAQLGYTRLYFQ